MRFKADQVFVGRAFAAIREFEALIEDHPRAAHRLEQLCDDLHFVALRYIRGAHCKVCEKHADLPQIEHELFCSEECRHVSKERAAETEKLIQESVAEAMGSLG